MSGNANLPIEIVVSVDKSSVGVAFADLEAKASSAGRKIGESLGKKVGGTDSYKELNAAFDKYQKNVSQGVAQLNTFKTSEAKRASAIEAAQYKELNAAFDAYQKNVAQGVSQLNAFKVAEAKKAAQAEIKAAKDVQAALKSEQRSSVFKTSGIRSPQDVANELASLREAKKVWEAAGKSAEGYAGQIDAITRRTNILTEGNARARGSFHKMTAAIASLTFEITGALYGLAAISGVVAGGAIFGISTMKRIEDARTGITGILVSMATLNGKALEFGEAWQVSGEYVKRIQQDSLRYGIDMGRLVEVNQAAISGGLTAMLTLEQIQKVATAGAIAVSSLGLNAQQYTQEVRDLISGGIQPASSTLARSIGVTDSLLKQWKAEGPEKLIGELTSRLQGFMVVADEVRTKTLTGSWDILQARLGMLLSDEEGFGAIKKAVIEVANYIGTVDLDTNKFEFNPEALSLAQSYWDQLKSIGSVLWTIGEIFASLSPIILKLSQFVAMAAIQIEMLFTTVVAGFANAKESVKSLFSGDLAGFFTGSDSVREKYAADMEGLGTRLGKVSVDFFGLGEAASESADKVAGSTVKMSDVTGRSTQAALTHFQDFYKKHKSVNTQYQDETLELDKVFYAAQLALASEFSDKMVQLSILANMKKNVMASSDYDQEGKDRMIAGLTRKEKAIADAAKSKALEDLRQQRSEIVIKQPKVSSGIAKAEKDLSKQLLEEYKARSAALDEQLATDLVSYSEWYDKKVALIEKSKAGGLDEDKAAKAMSELRIKLAKDSTAAMKDIDAATAKYADTMSAGERVIADFNNATKDKINIMEKEMVVLKALPNPTQEQKDKLEALTKSTDAYNKANVMVTETISPLAQALSNLAKITRETDAAIDKIDLEASLKGGGPLAMLEAQNLKLVELQNQYVRADEELKKFVQTQIDAGNTLADYDAETLERYTQLTNGVDKHRKAAKDLENQLDKTFGKGAKQAFEEYQIAAKDTASQANNLFSNMFKNIEDAFTNFIMTGKMDFKAFVNSMIADLARMAAKQIVLSFLGVTGMAGSGVAGASQTISTGSNLLGLAGGLMPSATGAGLLYGAGSWLAGGAAGAGATGMAGIGTGMMATANMGIGSGFLAGGQALLAGPAASGVSSSAAFGAMVPGIGVALAGIALLASFIKDKGGPKVEGNAFGTMNASGGMNIVRSADYAAPYGDGDWGRPGEQAAAVETALKPVGKSIGEFISKLGGDVTGMGFSLGFNSDPEGDAPDNVAVNVFTPEHEQIYRKVYDVERGKAAESLLENVNAMMLVTAQSVDLSPIQNALLDDLGDINLMSKDAIDAALASLASLPDLTGDAFENMFHEGFDIEKLKPLQQDGEALVTTLARLTPVFTTTDGIAKMLGQDVSTAFGGVGLASEGMRQKLIDGAGGMDKLTEQAGFFYQSFYSESERASKAVEAANNQVIASFAEIGIAVPESEAAFRSLVEGLDLSTESGQEMYQKLMDIAPAFDAVAEATKAATNSIASSLDKLRGNNAASMALATINRNDAMAALAANSDIETIDQLLTISAEDLAAYEKLNPAIYQLIAAALGAEATLQGLGDSATTAAAAAAAYSNSISMGEIISNSQAIVDGIMSTISGTVGTGFSATATTQITAMQDLITRTQEELAATPTTGDYTGNREQLRSIIHDANQQINILTSDLARYTELEAQYAGHGEALLELEKWYNSQLGVYQQYGISSTSLVEEFERRKLEILASGGADTVNGVTDVVDALKNSFSQLDSLIKLSDSIEDSINSVLAAQGDYQSGLVTVNRRLEEAREKLNNAVGIDEQTKAAGELKSAIMARYQAEANEIARIQSLISQLGQLSDRIRGSIESIKSSMLGYSGVNYATEQVSKGYAGLEDATTTEEQIIAADKLKEAIMGRYSAEMSDLQKRKDAENEAGRASVEATNKLNAAFRALGDYAKELLTGAESALTSPAKLAETQRQYDSLLTLARGGDVEAAGNIQGLASNLLGQSRDASVTALDYARSFSKVQGAMSELGTMAGTDREYAENTAKWEAETLGIQNRTIDELTLLGDLTETWITELEDTLPDLEALQQSTLEELERLNQLTVEWQEAINDSIIEQAIQFMQLNLTASQIAVELSGLDSRIAAIINATQKAILVEPDYTFTTMQLDSNIPGFASGGDHDGGWRVVGESGPELEYTQPSNIYSSSKSSDMFTSLATELSELRSELAASRQETLAANRAIAKNSMETAKMLQKWDGDGQPEVRVV